MSVFRSPQVCATTLLHTTIASISNTCCLQVQQVVGSIQNTNDIDVQIALITAPSYAKIVAEKYYSSNKTAHQVGGPIPNMHTMSASVHDCFVHVLQKLSCRSSSSNSDSSNKSRSSSSTVFLFIEYYHNCLSKSGLCRPISRGSLAGKEKFLVN